jgi:hypothetical protein
MRALTVRQPWAYAIIHLGKDVENRSRNIAGSYRGPIAIHAGKRLDTAALDEAARLAGHSVSSLIGLMADAPLGAIIGVVDLVDVHPSDWCWETDLRRVRDLYRQDREAFDALPDSGAGGILGKVRVCSPWAHDGQCHLVLANPRPCEPIPCKGRLGLWTVPDEVEAKIKEAMG